MWLAIVRSVKFFVDGLAFLVFVVETPHNILLNQVRNLHSIFFSRLIKLSGELLLGALVKVNGLFNHSSFPIVPLLYGGLPLDYTFIVFENSLQIVAYSERHFKILKR